MRGNTCQRRFSAPSGAGCACILAVLSGILAVAVLTCPPPCCAATLHVPEDYPAIQQAIAAADSGDTILVGPGTYNENLDTQGKQLSLLTTSGPAGTVVDGGRRARVLLLSGGGFVEGFTFRNGYALSGAGIQVARPTTVTIRNNVKRTTLPAMSTPGAAGASISTPTRVKS